MSYYQTRRFEEYDNADVNRLPSGLFFRVARAEHLEPQRGIPKSDIKQKKVVDHEDIRYKEFKDFVVPEYNSTTAGEEIYLPLLEVSIEVDVVATIAWTKLTQTFTNPSKKPIKEATYCMPLYDKSTVTSFVCTIGSNKILKGTVKPTKKAKAEFKEAVAKQQVAALLEEHTPEVFETNLGNIPAKTTVKVEISYITELKADLGGDGVLVTIPTSVAPRYGAMPSTMANNTAKSWAVPEKNGLQIKIQVSSPVAITKIEGRTHLVSVEMGSHGTRVTKDIRDFSKKKNPQSYDPKKAAATLSDRNACLGKDFVLFIEAKDGQLLASRAISEPHPTVLNRSALMVSINLRDMYTPDVVAPKTASEIIFVADRSGSMGDTMEALKTAMKFFLKSLPNNCIFNICSFGSTYELMWPKSQRYNQKTVNEALSYVAQYFSADMGGTEILPALQHAVKTSDPSMSTQIITLTDGELWDAPQLLEFIQETRSSPPNQNTRFFCLGIGEAVSHTLVAGIGRFGGGLAEVVPTDSKGDWMEKVIGMLRAALTPSSWTVDVTLDGVSTSENESGEQRCIQAPHQLPDFHAFSRSSVYFLLNQEFNGKVVKIKATSINKAETFAAEIPIEASDIGKKWVHQLAAKAVLGDLESGRSWLHEKSKNSTDLKAKTKADELAKIEGEKLGLEWNISSRWTSFIVVDEKNSLEKQSRWYQAGHSDLAELTRPRYEPRYNTKESLEYKARTGLLTTLGFSSRSKTSSSIQATGYADSSAYSPQSNNSPPVSMHRSNTSRRSTIGLWQPYPQSQDLEAIAGPERMQEASIRNTPEPPSDTYSPPMMATYEAQGIAYESKEESGQIRESVLQDGSQNHAGSEDAYQWSMEEDSALLSPFIRKGEQVDQSIKGSSSNINHRLWARDDDSAENMVMTMPAARSDSPDANDDSAENMVMATPAARSDSPDANDDLQQNNPELSQIVTPNDLHVDDSVDDLAYTEGLASKDANPIGPRHYYDGDFADHPRAEHASAGSNRHAPSSYFHSNSLYTPPRTAPHHGGSYSSPRPRSRTRGSPPSLSPARFYARRATNTNARSDSPSPPRHHRHRHRWDSDSPTSSRSSSPSQQLLTLSELLTTQHTLGYFSLPMDLWMSLSRKYIPDARFRIESLVGKAMPNRSAWLQKRESVLNTLMVVAYIEEDFVAEKKLWDLVVQKARAWLEVELLGADVRDMALEELRVLLRTPSDAGNDVRRDEVVGVTTTEAERGENVAGQPEGLHKEAEASLRKTIEKHPVSQGKKESVADQKKKKKKEKSRFSWLGLRS